MTEWRSRCYVSGQTLPLAWGLPARVGQLHRVNPEGRIRTRRWVLCCYFQPALRARRLVARPVAKYSGGSCAKPVGGAAHIVISNILWLNFKFWVLLFARCVPGVQNGIFIFYFYIRDRLIWLFIILINFCKRKINLCFTKSLFY